MIVERFVAAAGETWSTEKRWECRIARVGETWVIKPQTFMNLSGRSVAKVASFYKILPQEILGVYDDVSLPLGRIRLRASGSAGGHNGIKSMIGELGSTDFPRLKVGIDGARPTDDLADYVLGNFSRGEAETLEKTLQDSVSALRCVLDSGLAAAMNAFNRDPEAKVKPEAKARSKSPPPGKPADEPISKQTDAEEPKS
jgi:PTH1 family peptidyl-tRNA hydrolase